MNRWICGVSMKNRRTSKEFESWLDLNLSQLGSGRLRWYGHVMRKSDEDLVNTCI